MNGLIKIGCSLYVVLSLVLTVVLPVEASSITYDLNQLVGSYSANDPYWHSSNTLVQQSLLFPIQREKIYSYELNFRGSIDQYAKYLDSDGNEQEAALRFSGATSLPILGGSHQGYSWDLPHTSYKYENILDSHWTYSRMWDFDIQSDGGFNARYVQTFGHPWSTLGSGEGYQQMLFQVSGYAPGTLSQNGLVSITDANITFFTDIPDHINYPNNPNVPVPEPTTLLLLGAGFVGLIGSRINRKKKA